MTTPNYIPSLDGMRAVAVILVMLSHFGLGHLVPGGYGVTVFFFLSGFLITTLMRREYEQRGHISLSAFYMRRVLRIFPPFYITMLFMMTLSLVGLIGMFSWESVAYQVLFLTNYVKIAFPDGGHMPLGMGVCWSLAIEEHYYLVFPLIMMWLMPRMRTGRIATLLLAFCAVPLVWRIVLHDHLGASPERTLYGTDTRIDSIVFGCVLALWGNPVMDPPLRVGRTARVGLMVAFAAATIYTFVGDRSESFRETWRYTIQGVALYPLFYFAVSDPRHWLFAWLNWRPIRFIGAISYTLYLVHMAAWYMAGELLPASSVAVQAMLATAMSFTYAVVLYRWVEQPCARIRQRLHRRP